MANKITEVLNANGMSLFLFTGGMSKVGFGISGTWTGKVSFFAAADGLNFNPISVTPFASGTPVQSTTVNGNWEYLVQNFTAVKVVFSRTSGSAIVVIAASVDSSYQSAFLATTSIYVAQSHAAGAPNVLTQTAQANRAWRLRTLGVGFSAAPAAGVLCTVADGAVAIWETYIAATAGDHPVVLPADAPGAGIVGGGVVTTPGNSLVITVADPGGAVVSKINAEVIPA